MTQIKKYRSFSFNPFDVIRILLFGFVVLFLLCLFITKEGNASLFYSLIIIVLIEIGYVISTYSEVTLTDNDLLIQNMYRHVNIKGLKEIKTWWSYDYGISNPSMSDGSIGQSNPIANKINCFVKFVSENQVGIIYEQIYLGSKFPNNHPYKPNQIIDQKKLIKVWDIDQCLKTLELKQAT